MSVILETSKGDIVLDLFVDECPKTVQNFLKLCEIKYYNNCIFHYVQRDFLVQTGDPTKTGRGGESIHGLLYGPQARFFSNEIVHGLKHREKGMVGMASAGKDQNASQFYITTGSNLDSLDDKHTIFGQVAEGWDVLGAINDMPCDEDGRPLQNVRIRHTIVLDDPTPALAGLEDLIPEQSPEPEFSHDGRLEDDWNPENGASADPRETMEKHQEQEAKNRAAVLEMIGDLPEADAAPPPNVLFICKLNPVTQEEDLEIIFGRFGRVKSCDIIRDWKTGDSLCYAFIGFDSEASCEEAYFKMNNVLIDDRRIKVDFSQSVSHLWKQYKKFGTKGDQGASFEQQEPRRQGLQLKDRHRRGPSSKRYDYVFEDEEDPRESGRDRHRKKKRARMGSMPSKHGSTRGGSSALLRSKLRQLKRVSAADVSIQSNSSTSTTEQSWVSEEEEATFSPDQLEFLTRKRRAAAGLGPIMPDTSRCASCDGEGMVVCSSCAGSGSNREGLAQDMFDGKPVVVNNGIVDPRWMFIDNGPCWLCKGTTMIACKDCGGVGIVGIMEKFSGD